MGKEENQREQRDWGLVLISNAATGERAVLFTYTLPRGLDRRKIKRYMAARFLEHPTAVGNLVDDENYSMKLVFVKFEPLRSRQP